MVGGGAGRGGSGGPPGGQKKPAAAEKVKIRPKYVEGRAWGYQLKLSGATAWAPAAKGLQWGKMTTDFTFVLLPKAFRDNGSCTFHLIGEHLRSVGENAEGLFGVDATRQSARAKVKGKWRRNVPTPLAKPMTLTIGPLGAVRFGTGLVPVALFMRRPCGRWARATSGSSRCTCPCPARGANRWC